MRKLLRFLTVPLLLWGLLANAQTRKITGKVTSSDNKAVASATVSVKSSKVKTVSNENGQFSLTVPNGAVTLEVSSLGYATKQVQVGANETTVNVVLASSQNELTEVVVTALGITKDKKALGYATTTIKYLRIKILSFKKQLYLCPSQMGKSLKFKKIKSGLRKQRQ